MQRVSIAAGAIACRGRDVVRSAAPFGTRVGGGGLRALACAAVVINVGAHAAVPDIPGFTAAGAE